MNIIGWIIYGLFLVINISFSYGIVRSIQMKKPLTHAIAMQAFLFWIIIVYFYFNPDLSKLHILWLSPLLFLIGSFLGSRLFSTK